MLLVLPSLHSLTPLLHIPDVVPIFVAAVLAPLPLELFGGEYAAQGTEVLSVLVLAAAPRAVSVFAMSQARADRGMSFILRTQAVSAILVIGASVLLTPSLGVLGMAVAWSATQGIVCLIVLPYLLSSRPWPSR
jgi:O-antigen/teichoic acid export membrane protein